MRQVSTSVFRAHLRALALSAASPPSHSLRFNLGGLVVHSLGLIAISRLAHWPLWSAPLLLAGFCLPQILLRRWFIESLTPLCILYSLAGLRLGLVYGLRQTVPTALDYDWGLGLSAVWAGLIFLRDLRRLRYAWGMLALAAAGLMFYLLWLNLPAGVTGSDPFAYVQMALDLARHGTPLHQFPLAPFAASLGLPTLPTTHVGYVLPNARGLAPTVWPPGYSVLLAAASLAGEKGMLALNVWIGLLSLILTLALTIWICPARWRRLPLWVGMGATTLVATSPEQLTRLIVPLADGAAQALTALAVGLAFYAVRVSARPSTSRGNPSASLRTPRFAQDAGLSLTGLGILTGLALAAAYSVRYTQVLIAPGIVLIAWFGLRDVKRRLEFLLPFAIAALLGALPDAWYRTQLYGAPWRFGSGELALFSIQALPETLRHLSTELFASREFGLWWPLLLVGAVYLWQRNRLALIGLTSTYGSLLTFHLWYPFVKLRDVLSVYPPLAALSALGGAVLLIGLWRRGAAMRLIVIGALFALALFRLSPALGFRQGFFTFGYLRLEQRRALESLTTLTEPDAVIADSLNSGAVEMYGQRSTVRPGNLLQPGLGWDQDQWLGFVAALQSHHRPLYLLMDSPEMDAPLAALRDRYTLTRVVDLDVPVYFVGGGSLNLTVPLYRVEP